ncbi:hypothetical protein ABPG72_013043 [Tetrahymena utriculariae]
MSESPQKKRRAISAYGNFKMNSIQEQNTYENTLIQNCSPPKIKNVQVMHLSQIQQLKNPKQEQTYQDLVNKRGFRLRYFQYQKLDSSLYIHSKEVALNNTFCQETLGQPDLLSQSALNFTKKQQYIQKNKEIKLFGKSPTDGKKHDKKNLNKFISQIAKKRDKFSNLTVKIGLKNLLLGSNNTQDMNFDLSEKSSPAELHEDYDLEYEDIYLQEEYSHQPDEVLRFVLKGKDYYSKQEPELLKKWISCLPIEERMEIEKDKTYFPVPHRLMMHQIDQGLNEMYGTGKNRILRPGEEATIIETISRFLSDCQNIDIFHRIATSNVNSILQYLLKICDLFNLVEFPLAMKQIECHWKIMATRFRCSDKMPSDHKLFEKYVYMAHLRGHFFQLQKQDNPLVTYLLKYSCMKADYLRMKEEIEKKNQNRRKSVFNITKRTNQQISLPNSKKQEITSSKFSSLFKSINNTLVYEAD